MKATLSSTFMWYCLLCCTRWFYISRFFLRYTCSQGKHGKHHNSNVRTPYTYGLHVEKLSIREWKVRLLCHKIKSVCAIKLIHLILVWPQPFFFFFLPGILVNKSSPRFHVRALDLLREKIWRPWKVKITLKSPIMAKRNKQTKNIKQQNLRNQPFANFEIHNSSQSRCQFDEFHMNRLLSISWIFT